MKKMFKQIALVATVALCAMLFFGLDASAYIDPSVGGALITAISGLVIAVGAVVGVLFRRAKKKISKNLNIDENRNKEVESDEIEAKDASEEAKDVIEKANDAVEANDAAEVNGEDEAGQDDGEE